MNIIASRVVGVALFGGLAAFLTFGPASAHIQILALLLGWVSYSHFDGKLDGLKRAVVHGLAGGVLGIGAASFLAQHSRFGAAVDFPIWAALGVAITLALVVIATKIQLLGDIVGLLLGYAAVVGTASQNGALEAILAPSLENPAIVVIVSLIVGALFGYGADLLRDALGSVLSRGGKAVAGAHV
jgi:hypothetical protein